MASRLIPRHPFVKLYEMMIGASRPKGDWFPLCLILSLVVAIYLMTTKPGV